MSPTTRVPSRLTLTETSESTMCSRRRHRTLVITLYCSYVTLRRAIGSLLGFPRTSDSLVAPCAGWMRTAHFGHHWIGGSSGHLHPALARDRMRARLLALADWGRFHPRLCVRREHAMEAD